MTDFSEHLMDEHNAGLDGDPPEPYCPHAVDDGGVVRYCEKRPGHDGVHLSVVVFPGDAVAYCEVTWYHDTPVRDT
jgi:hypothetical protein